MLKNSKSNKISNLIHNTDKRKNQWNEGLLFKKSKINENLNPILQNNPKFYQINIDRKLNDNYLTTMNIKDSKKDFLSKKKVLIKNKDNIWKPSVRPISNHGLINNKINKTKSNKNFVKPRNPILTENEFIKEIKVRPEYKPHVLYESMNTSKLRHFKKRVDNIPNGYDKNYKPLKNYKNPKSEIDNLIFNPENPMVKNRNYVNINNLNYDFNGNNINKNSLRPKFFTRNDRFVSNLRKY